jgi:predicted transcriptional regulator YheO
MSSKRTFRDFLYDKNDIIIAILIIAAAMLLIAWRVMKVMDYPNTLDSVKTAEEVKTAAEEENNQNNETDGPTAKWDGRKLAEDITLTLSDESTDAAITSLISAGLFETADQFKYICKRTRVSDADVKAGKFTFKKGSTRADIVKQVTA